MDPRAVAYYKARVNASTTPEDLARRAAAANSHAKMKKARNETRRKHVNDLIALPFNEREEKLAELLHPPSTHGKRLAKPVKNAALIAKAVREHHNAELAERGADDYQIIYGADVDGFRHRVQHALAGGYLLQGGIAVDGGVYHQAVVKKRSSVDLLNAEDYLNFGKEGK
jgi:hypothetical protein